MANIISSIRIICSIGLLFCPVLSPAFLALYLIAGITDILDGAVARKTNYQAGKRQEEKLKK